MDIREYDETIDNEFYLEGDVDAFKNSFPGVAVPGSLISEFKHARSGISENPFKAGFTAINELGYLGFVVVSLMSFYNVPGAYVESIYVRESNRGHGVVEALLDKAQEWALSQGAKYIELDVSLSNERAISAYEKHGFIQTRVQMQKPL